MRQRDELNRIVFFFLRYLRLLFFTRANGGGGDIQGGAGKASLNSLVLWRIILCWDPGLWVCFLSLSLSRPFLFVVVADTLGKQFVSHLIAFEKLKNGNHNRGQGCVRVEGGRHCHHKTPGSLGTCGMQCDRATIAATTMQAVVLQRTHLSVRAGVCLREAICCSASWLLSATPRGWKLKVFTGANNLTAPRCVGVRSVLLSDTRLMSCTPSSCL